MANRRDQAQIQVANASVRFLRVPPRKVRLVADQIRGKSVGEARRILQFSQKRGVAPHVHRLLKSAVANVDKSQFSNVDDLMVGNIQVDSGPMLKRWRPRAYGRASRILKRMSHVRLILTER